MLDQDNDVTNGAHVETKKEVAYNIIKNRIISGEFDNETLLVERTLCDQLQMSRTPVREALRELANDDLVEIIDGKGASIKRISFRDMVELFEVREALERMAVKLFMERAEQEQLDLLLQYMEEQQKAYDADDHIVFMEIDMRIHVFIGENSKNERLKREISNIYDQVRRLAISSRDDKLIRDIAIKDHWKIVKAVLNGDSESAEEAIVEHIVNVKQFHMNRFYLL